MASAAAAADWPGGDGRGPAGGSRRAWLRRRFYTECLRLAIDHWRRSGRARGRGKLVRVLDKQQHGFEVEPDVIHDILEGLESVDPEAGLIAKLKVFQSRPDDQNPGRTRGLTNGEVAEFVGFSLRKVEKDWAYAKAYLMRRLSELEEDDEDDAGETKEPRGD